MSGATAFERLMHCKDTYADKNNLNNVNVIYHAINDVDNISHMDGGDGVGVGTGDGKDETRSLSTTPSAYVVVSGPTAKQHRNGTGMELGATFSRAVSHPFFFRRGP